MKALLLRYRRLMAAVALMVGAVACGGISKSCYVVDIEDNRWESGVAFEIPNEDTLSWRDISIFVKHQPYAKIDSIAMQLYVTSPSDVIHQERIVFHLDDCHRGASVMAHLHTMPYRRDVIWSEVGSYHLHIFPETAIEGIEGVGVSIE